MDLSNVEKLLSPYLEEHQLKLYDIEIVKEFGYLILRVSIDKKGGITVDELAMANEYLSEKLDAIDADMPEYMLEVCSPGAEKPLKSIDEVKEHIGAYIHVEILNMVYEGILESVLDNNIKMKINAKGRFKTVVVQYENIKSIRLAVKI